MNPRWQTLKEWLAFAKDYVPYIVGAISVAYAAVTRQPLLILVLAIAVAAAWRWLRPKSQLLRREALRLDWKKGHFVGREDKVADVVAACDQHGLVFVTGESGVGKSTLLQAGVLPALNDRYAVAYVSHWGTTWEDDPAHFTIDAFARTLTADGWRDVGGSKAVGPNDLEGLLDRIHALLHRTPLIVFDQFEDYQAAHSGSLTVKGNPITADELMVSNRFWRAIGNALRNRHAKCVFALRRETTHQSLSFMPSQEVTVPLLPGGWARQLLDTVTAGEGVIANAGAGFEDLKELLCDHLEEAGPDNPRAFLPIELEMVLRSLRSRPHLISLDEYRDGGGLAGLVGEYMAFEVHEAAKSASLATPEVRGVLLSLVDRADRSSPRRTPPQPAAALLERVSEPHRRMEKLEKALQDLEAQDIVQPIVLPDGTRQWQLYHSYLASAILTLESKEGQWQRLLKESSQTFKRQWRGWTSLWRPSVWSTTLPPAVQVRLAWERVAGHLRYGPDWPVATLSMVRLVLNIPILVLIGFSVLMAVIVTARRAAGIVGAFDSSSSLSPGEAAALWRLHDSSDGVQAAALDGFLTSPAAAERFVSHGAEVIHAVLGLHPRDRLHVIEAAFDRRCAGADVSGADSHLLEPCALLAVEVPAGKVPLHFFVEVVRGWRREPALMEALLLGMPDRELPLAAGMLIQSDFAHAKLALLAAPRNDRNWCRRTASRLVDRALRAEDPDALGSTALVLSELGAEVLESGATDQIIEAMEKSMRQSLGAVHTPTFMAGVAALQDRSPSLVDQAREMVRARLEEEALICRTSGVAEKREMAVRSLGRLFQAGAALPGEGSAAHREAILAALACLGATERFWSQTENGADAVAAALGELSRAQRQTLFDTLLPSIGAARVRWHGYRGRSRPSPGRGKWSEQPFELPLEVLLSDLDPEEASRVADVLLATRRSLEARNENGRHGVLVALKQLARAVPGLDRQVAQLAIDDLAAERRDGLYGIADVAPLLDRSEALEATGLILGLLTGAAAGESETPDAVIEALASIRNYVTPGDVEAVFMALAREDVPDCHLASSLTREDSLLWAVDVLKWPTCSATARAALLDAIAAVRGEPAEGATPRRAFRMNRQSIGEWLTSHGFDAGPPTHRPPPMY